MRTSKGGRQRRQRDTEGIGARWMGAASSALGLGCLLAMGVMASGQTVLPLTVTAAPLAGGTVGSPYSATLGATGGVPPYNWTVSSGSLPPGLALGAATGVVSGTPIFAPGSPFQFNIAVTDTAGNRSAPQSFSISIGGSDATPAPQRIVTTLAGTDFVFTGNGKPALQAQIDPLDVAVDKNGNYYIADPGNNRIQQISPSGILTTIAGNGIAGFSGDGGPAVNASLNNPYALALDSAGNIYVADTNNLRIREITTDGIISTIAGSGGSGITGDGGQAIFATFVQPLAVAVDNLNNVYVADADPSELDSRVRKITPAGMISTLAGNGNLKFPTGVAADSLGNVYIADPYACRVFEALYLVR
ncbi:MAG: putative Ig domain-containing protein [Bryobacteraceae bacterium]